MPEYFNISLIIDKNKYTKENIEQCLSKNFNIQEGENNFEDHEYAIFAYKNILLGFYGKEGVEFDEFYICLPEQFFHKHTFEKELKPITEFIQKLFAVCQGIEFALCSYEMNAYHLSDIKHMKDFTNDFLMKFPIVYIKKQDDTSEVRVNLQAQDIFAVM